MPSAWSAVLSVELSLEFLILDLSWEPPVLLVINFCVPISILK